jgi:hypothetical protein
MLIPSFYATTPRTRSLRPVRVPSDQNTRWRLSFYFSTNKRQEFLVSTHLSHIRLDFEGGCFRRDAADVRQAWRCYHFTLVVTWYLLFMESHICLEISFWRIVSKYKTMYSLKQIVFLLWGPSIFIHHESFFCIAFVDIYLSGYTL